MGATPPTVQPRAALATSALVAAQLAAAPAELATLEVVALAARLPAALVSAVRRVPRRVERVLATPAPRTNTAPTSPGNTAVRPMPNRCVACVPKFATPCTRRSAAVTGKLTATPVRQRLRAPAYTPPERAPTRSCGATGAIQHANSDSSAQLTPPRYLPDVAATIDANGCRAVRVRITRRRRGAVR